MAKKATKVDPAIDAFLSAVGQGDVAAVRAMLADGINPDAQGPGGSALSHAICGGSADVVRLLIDAGADVHSDRSLLFDAVKFADVEVLRLLLDAGADVNNTPRGNSPVELAACGSGSDEKLRALLDAGADPTNPLHRDALSSAISAKRSAAALMLIEAGALKKAKDKDALLVTAADGGMTQVVSALLAAGASPDARSDRYSDGGTALMAAAGAGHLDVVRLLLESGADATIRDATRRTAADWVNKLKPKTAKQVLALLAGSGSTAGARRDDDPPDFKSAAAAPPFKAALEELGAITQSKPKRHPDIEGGFYFPADDAAVAQLVERHQSAFLTRGCLLFACDQGLGVLPSSDELDAVRAMETAGPHYDVTTADILEWLRRERANLPLRVVGATFERLTLKLPRPLPDPAGLARRIAKICPPLGEEPEEGIESMTLVDHLASRDSIELWWD